MVLFHKPKRYYLWMRPYTIWTELVLLLTNWTRSNKRREQQKLLLFSNKRQGQRRAAEGGSFCPCRNLPAFSKISQGERQWRTPLSGKDNIHDSIYKQRQLGVIWRFKNASNLFQSKVLHIQRKMQHLAFLETLDIAGFAKHKCESWKICLILHRLIWISKKIILYHCCPR